MKKVKLAFWMILLGLIGVVFWQNRPFFLDKKGIEVDYFFGNIQIPETQIALYLLVCFLMGLLISYIGSLSERFVARKTIRKLNNELSAANKKNADLEASLAGYTSGDSSAALSVSDEAPSAPDATPTT